MDQDQTEDFEMRPITAGLGFHKRPVSLREHVANSGLAQQNLRRSLPTPPADEMLETSQNRTSKEIIAELHRALEPKPKARENSAASQVRLSETLPREVNEIPRTRTEIERERTKNPLEKIDFQIPDAALKNTTLNSSTATRRGAHDGLVNPLTPVSVNFSSLALDAIIVMAMSLIFLVSLVTVTGINLSSVIHSARADFAAQLSLIVLYFAVFEMYMIVARSFFGCTVGEWTFDLQLGSEEQMARANYPALVLWRSVLNLVTGLIVLPLISLALGRDFAASLTGLQLYRKNT
jgi:hypothetical protein